MDFKLSKAIAGIACGLGLVLSSGEPLAESEGIRQVGLSLMTSSVMSAASDWRYVQDESRRLWLGYYDAQRILRLRDPKGEEQPMAPADRAQAPSGIAMTARPNGALLLWRDKYPQKGLYVADLPASGSEPKEIGGDTEPLARFVAESDGSGRAHFLWYGEKALESTNERYSLFYRNWDPKEKVFSDIEVVMPGIYPVMAIDERGQLMVFSWRADAGAARIDARFRSANSGEKSGFRDTVTVAEVPAITPIFKALRVGKRWMVVWLGQYGLARNDFRLEGAYSDDDGGHWTRFLFDGLKGMDIGSLQTASDDEGHILIAVTGRNREADPDAKQDVFIVRSSDAGASWSDAVRLRAMASSDSQDSSEPDLLHYFNARNPSVAFGSQPGEVLVVWEDWRTIRSSLYASLSKDFGETWSLSNVPLPRPAGVNLQLRYEPNAIYVSGDRYQVLAEQYEDDTLKSKRLVEVGLDSASLAAYADKLGKSSGAVPTGTEEALRNRASAYWQAMEDRDFSKTYEYLDPFFKARTPLDTYTSLMGKIKYRGAKVGEIKIVGPLAEVNTKVQASVPAFRVPSTGEKISQPEREINIKNRWLWVDGEWVNEYRLESQDLTYTKY